MDLEQAYDKVYRYLYFKLHDKDLAEDMTQEAFLRYINQKGSAVHIEMNYLYTIARNLCIDEFRRIKPSPFPQETDHELSSDEPDPTEKVSLRMALDKLSSDDRELLLLRYVNEERIGTISKMLHLSRFSIYRRLKAAEQKLREELEVTKK